MKFEVRTGQDNGCSIELLDGGKVHCTEWTFNGLGSCYLEDGPYTWSGDDTPYEFFVDTLNCVAERYPEVYRTVYEHIQGRTENVYVLLAKYCKDKNNQHIKIS